MGILAGTRIAPAQRLPGTWAGGTTHMIAAHPPDAAQQIASAQLWVGTANIEQDAPYSFFSERMRIQIPVHGNGIKLHFQHPAEAVTLTHGEPYRFDGARPVQVALIDGPIRALNVIFHRSVIAKAHVVRLEGNQQLSDLAPFTNASAAHQILLQIVYVICGSLALRHAHDQAIMLHTDDAFVLHPQRQAADTHPAILLECQGAPVELVVVQALVPAQG